MARAVIGRDDELGLVRGLLDRAEAGTAALVLTGEPGIGKTILWESGVEEARRQARVLACRGAETEAAMTFAGLADLLAGCEDVVSELLPLRREALEVALMLREPGDSPPDPRAIGIAFLDVLRKLADRGPLVVAVDDLQWLDAPSAAALQVALRRLRDEPVAFLATVRVAEGIVEPFAAEQLLPEERVMRLALGPLALSALHQLLRSRLGLELSRPELARVEEATGGNPFFALELGRELARAGVRAEPGRPLPVPDTLGTLLRGRLDRLPAETRHVLLSAAATARPAAELLVEVHGAHALTAVERAAEEGVLVLDGSRIRFAHPLLSSVCYEQAPLWKRRAAHRRLAAAVEDPEERARHLALAAEGPDGAVAAELDAAAEQAAARGATASAAELAELAARLTAEDDAQRCYRAASFHRLAGNFERASAIWQALLEELPPGVERSDVLYALANTGVMGLPERIRLCEQAVADAAGDDARVIPILGFLAISRWLGGDVPSALADARRGLKLAERLDDPRLRATALMRVGLIEMWALEETPGLLERAVEIERTLDRPLLFHESPLFGYMLRLRLRDEPDRARELIREADRQAVERGDEQAHLWAVLFLAELEGAVGRFELALEHAASGVELAEQTQEPQYRAMIGREQAAAQARLGLIEDARASAEAALAAAEKAGDETYVVHTRAVLGHIELTLGNHDAAVAQLRELPARLLAMGLLDPVDSDVWPDAIEALLAAGERERAASYVAELERFAGRGSRRLLSQFLYARGLLTAADGQPACDFEEALRELETLPYPFERARTLLALGRVRRHANQKRAAREALEQALALFEELGAPLWAAKARAELRRISGRRAESELTEAERRVVSLAAEGRSNKEIAAALVMSVRTVESHLSHVYRKLGIRSRAALAHRLSVDAAPKVP
jgi:DNA-binding CsgD family transcriptional regulator